MSHITTNESAAPTEPSIFDFEGASMRATSRDGNPGFFLVDVCKILEIGNPSDAARRLDEDEKYTLDIIEGANFKDLGVIGAMPTIITEAGLYSLILTSRKPAAKRFKRWITHEVLPAIRKTGGYMVAAPEETPEQLALRALQVLQATVERQKVQIAAIQPKAEALDRIATADGSLSITEAAKALQVRPKELFDFLNRNSWIYKRAGSANYLGYQSRTNAGDLEHKVATILKPDGSERVCEQVKVTAAGLAKLAKLMPSRVAEVKEPAA